MKTVETTFRANGGSEWEPPFKYQIRVHTFDDSPSNPIVLAPDELAVKPHKRHKPRKKATGYPMSGYICQACLRDPCECHLGPPAESKKLDEPDCLGDCLDGAPYPNVDT
jgi:hypothetical protein